MSIREIAQNLHNICPKYIPPLSEFCHCFCPKIFHCFCPNFPLLLPEFREKAMGNSGKSNGKFGQKQWENLGKSNEKNSESGGIYFGQKLLLLPEFSTAFARIFRFQKFLGGTVPLCPPPPPASYAYALY